MALFMCIHLRLADCEQTSAVSPGRPSAPSNGRGRPVSTANTAAAHAVVTAAMAAMAADPCLTSTAPRASSLKRSHDEDASHSGHLEHDNYSHHSNSLQPSRSFSHCSEAQDTAARPAAKRRATQHPRRGCYADTMHGAAQSVPGAAAAPFECMMEVAQAAAAAEAAAEQLPTASGDAWAGEADGGGVDDGRYVAAAAGSSGQLGGKELVSPVFIKSPVEVGDPMSRLERCTAAAVRADFTLHVLQVVHNMHARLHRWPWSCTSISSIHATTVLEAKGRLLLLLVLPCAELAATSYHCLCTGWAVCRHPLLHVPHARQAAVAHSRPARASPHRGGRGRPGSSRGPCEFGRQQGPQEHVQAPLTPAQGSCASRTPLGR